MILGYKDFEPKISDLFSSVYLGEKVNWNDIEYIGFNEGYYVYNSVGYVDGKKKYTSILEFAIDGSFDNINYIEKI